MSRRSFRGAPRRPPSLPRAPRMKRVDFPAATDDLDLYNLTYIALNNPEARLSPAELRVHGKILDKIEPLGAKQTDGSGFKLPKGCHAVLVLEDAELAL